MPVGWLPQSGASRKRLLSPTGLRLEGQSQGKWGLGWDRWCPSPGDSLPVIPLPRFGLFSFDPETFERRERPSAAVFRRLGERFLAAGRPGRLHAVPAPVLTST